MTEKIGVDLLGDRLKAVERLEAGKKLDAKKPLVCRLDGKSFHTYTKKMKKPFDEVLIKAMQETTKFLIEKSHADIGYTQSDEITLVYLPKENSTPYLDSKVQKLTSILASFATAKFNQFATENSLSKDFAFFDSRVWNVETNHDVFEVFLWRQEDAVKNSISMLAQAHFSAKELHKKSSRDKIEMLKEKGIRWEAQPEHFKSGTFWARKLSLKEVPVEFKSYSNDSHVIRSSVEEKTFERLRKEVGKVQFIDFIENANSLKKEKKKKAKFEMK